MTLAWQTTNVYESCSCLASERWKCLRKPASMRAPSWKNCYIEMDVIIARWVYSNFENQFWDTRKLYIFEGGFGVIITNLDLLRIKFKRKRSIFGFSTMNNIKKWTKLPMALVSNVQWVAGVQSVLPLRSANNFQWVWDRFGSKWFSPFPVLGSSLTES